MINYAYVAFAVLLAGVAAVSSRPVHAAPPDLTQWQRDIEEERVNEAIAKGDFEAAVELASGLVKDYRRAAFGDRSGRNGRLSPKAAKPQLIRLNFLLAQTERLVGDYERARTLFEKIDDDISSQIKELRSEALATSQNAAIAESQVMGAYLTWLNGYETTRGRAVRAANVVGASMAADNASANDADAKQRLFKAMHFQATFYDEYGALELDAGKNRHAETLFRKSTYLWGNDSSIGAISDSRIKHLRHYARLYVKDAEGMLADKARGETALHDAHAALDRAEIYLEKAMEALRSEPPRTTGSGGVPEEDTVPATQPSWSMADLLFQFAEYHTARADQIGSADSSQAMAHLDKAEDYAVRSMDQLLSLVPSRHPFTAYGWIELAGINARRIIYSHETDVSIACRMSYADDMRAYWKRGQEVVSASGTHKDNPVFKLLDGERALCKQAHDLAKRLDDVAPLDDDDTADPGIDDSGEPFPAIGSSVRRGPNWDAIWIDADGGDDPESIGTVVRIEAEGWLAVEWARTGRTTIHRPGGEGRNDLVDLEGNVAIPRPTAIDVTGNSASPGLPGSNGQNGFGPPRGPMNSAGVPGFNGGPSGLSGGGAASYPPGGVPGQPAMATPPGTAPGQPAGIPPGYGPSGSPSPPSGYPGYPSTPPAASPPGGAYPYGPNDGSPAGTSPPVTPSSVNPPGGRSE